METKTDIYEIRMYVTWEYDVQLSPDGWEDVRDRLKKLTRYADIIDGYVEEGYMSFTIKWDGSGIDHEVLRTLVDTVAKDHLEKVVRCFWGGE
jgi:hypothetical protein